MSGFNDVITLLLLFLLQLLLLLLWLLLLLFYNHHHHHLQQQGAACSVFCATARELEGLGGKYFVNCFEIEPSLESLNQETSSMLWLISKNMVGKAATLRDDYSREESLFCKPSGEISV